MKRLYCEDDGLRRPRGPCVVDGAVHEFRPKMGRSDPIAPSTAQGARGPPKAKQVLGPATMSVETRPSAMVAMGRLLEFMGCVAPIGHHLGDRCLRKVKVKLRAQIKFPASTGSSKARSVF